MKGVYHLSGPEAPKELEGYYKISSIYLLHRYRLPTLDGLVIMQWDKSIAEYVFEYLRQKGWKDVVIRTDKKEETGGYIRGGYLCPVEKLEKEVVAILKLGRIVAILEPVNKYENLYGVNWLISIKDQYVIAEVVGPGFDISDINRGDTCPHEIIQFYIEDKLIKFRICSRKIISQPQYLLSVIDRLKKIGREIVLRKGGDPNSYSDTALIEAAKDYLQSTGWVMLLSHSEKYTPIPTFLLKTYIDYLADLPWLLENIAHYESFFVIPSSIIKTGQTYRFIFWDIIFPTRKYVILGCAES